MPTISKIQSSHCSLMTNLFAKNSLPIKFTIFLLLLLQTSQASPIISRTMNQQKKGRKLIESEHQNELHKEEKDDNEWFKYLQTLDHFNFNPQSYTRFLQRYAINSRYWGGSNTTSPIFVIAGDDWALQKLVYAYYGFTSLANRFKALILYIEHRYYGHSMPFGSKAEAFQNSSTRGYLSSAQVLADYAEIILHVKNNLKAKRCPVIILGGSYGGMLAAWFRLKYPHIVIGAIASSAPILYFDNITPQNAFSSIISKNFQEVSKTCFNTIKKSWTDIDHVASLQDGLTTLGKTFNTCRPINDSQGLKDYMISKFTFVAQRYYPYNALLKQTCHAIDTTIGNTLSKVKAGVAMASLHSNCIDAKIITKSKDNGQDYQSCTEIVRPIGRGPDSIFPPAPFDIKKYMKDCEEQFGVTPRPNWITIEFGGHNISFVLKNFASNIIFSNGLKDPYSVPGVLKSISNTVVALVTEEGGSCFDIIKPEVEDPKWLVEQRNVEIKTIDNWLSEYKANLDKSR